MESLRSSDPREYWKGLADLDPTNVKSTSSIPLVVKNSENKIVEGLAASQVWMDSFAKLGLESSDFKDYDVDFYYQIKQSVNQFQVESFTTNFALDYPISLEEVGCAIKKLRKGKAVGIDGLFNEIWKYGGEDALTYLWKLYQRYLMGKISVLTGPEVLYFPYLREAQKSSNLTLISIGELLYSV